MIRVRRPVLACRRMAGLSLIEMMIALVMALIVAAGIITVFQSTSSSNRVQSQLATLQEEGRFAIHSLRADLRNANGGYCSNSGGNAGITPSGLYLDALRAPTVFSNTALLLPNNTVTGLPAPTQPYSLPSSLFMRGYDCGTTAASCKPADPATGGIPGIGTAVGDRVPGTSVLTVRYLKPGSGWAIVPPGSPSGSTMDVTGSPVTITLDPLTGEPPKADFTGTLALLADCNNAKVYAVTSGAGVVTLTGANYAQPGDISRGKAPAPRIFDFSNDFQTVTYYLRVVDADNGHTTGELVREVNDTPQPLVRGVERLDFRYGIVNADGKTEFLTANEVDTATDALGNSVPCPPGVDTDGGMGNAGCLWRAVQTIEVHILMDGQTPLYTLTPAEMYYIYSPDGDITPAAPATHDIQPNADQGFPEPLLRREFTTVVSLRNFNP